MFQTELFTDEEQKELIKLCPRKSRRQKRDESREIAVEYLGNLGAWLRTGRIRQEAAEASKEIVRELRI